MKAKFLIKYGTAFGECLKMDFEGTVVPMQWSAGNIWKAETDLPCGRHIYTYSLWRSDVPVRTEKTPHSIVLDAPSSGNGEASYWDWWQDAPAGHYAGLGNVFGPFGTRAAGIAVPVFSLRGEGSFGIGEFCDLKELVDFALAASMRCIQLLPINDTTRTFTWMDSYPYNACSSFALHPQFINLEKAGVVPDREYFELKDELNACNGVDYERVNKTKDRYLREAFALSGRACLATEGFKDFLRRNSSWLVPYACFRALACEHGSADFSLWGEMAVFSQQGMQKYSAAQSDEVNYHMWVQYKLDCQLSEVVAYARERGVHFKGDLPIGVSRHSADAWQHPDLFNMESSAGAPPDFFSRDGQNWGFPTYNWDAMARDGYAWWRARLGKMAEYFDAYRIDHILGFFRIWEIPYSRGAVSGTSVSGMYGHFNPQLPYSEDEIRYFDIAGTAEGEHPMFVEDPRRKGFYSPLIGAYDQPAFHMMSGEQKAAFDILYKDFFYYRHNEFWKDLAMRKLAAVTGSTSMLSCGEDLGMIPACVPEVMEHFNILSLEMPRMPKKLGQEFSPMEDYPYASVSTTSTHDMSPMRLWWHESPEQAAHYYHDVLGLQGDVPADPSPELCRAIVAGVLASPSMLCIIPLQDYLACSGTLRIALDGDDSSALGCEQVNDPANNRHYWRYRMNCSIKNMLADVEFCEHIGKLVRDAVR